MTSITSTTQHVKSVDVRNMMPMSSVHHENKVRSFKVILFNTHTHKETHHEVLPCQADRFNGALNVDCGFLLGAVGVREVDLGSRSLGDVLDVASIATLHEEVVLGCDVQVGGD